MGLSDLPPELRYTIYTHWFTNRTFKPTSPVFVSSKRYGLPGDRWLSDAFVISKGITYDPWLTHAVLQHSTFHIDNATDLADLRRRFGDDALQRITRISLGAAMTANEVIPQVQTVMPKLSQIQLAGCVTPMWRIWNLRLEGLSRHEWTQYVACLCIFAPIGVLGKSEYLMEQVLSKEIELVVDFVWSEPEYGKRRMHVSTKDWLLRYEHRGQQYALRQVQPAELQAALDEEKPLW